MSNLQIEIISPEGIIFNGEGHLAVVPSTLGDIGFMQGHESVIALLRAGDVVIFDQDKNIIKQVAVIGGYAEMDGATKLSVLVEGDL